MKLEIQIVKLSFIFLLIGLGIKLIGDEIDR